MKKQFLQRIKDKRGQGLTEYIIIAALIAIAAIGVVTLFGDNIRALFAGASDALSGETSVKVNTQKSSSSHTKTKTLKTFGSDLKGKH